MSEPEVIPWVRLLTLMVDGPELEPTVRGTISCWDGDEQRAVGYVRYENDPDPVFAGTGLAAEDDGGTSMRVWRDGSRVRIDRPDGRPLLIVGTHFCWKFSDDDEAPVQSPVGAVRYVLGGTDLLTRRTADDFLGNDFTRPTGPATATTFLGRPAWAVELAPPPHKPYPLRLVVDAESGLVLQQRNDAFGFREEWTEFVLGERLPDEIFQWDGSSRSATDQQAARLAAHEADLERRRAWFAEQVAPLPLRLELACSVVVHQYDEETGAFQASFGSGQLGMLARRPAGAKDSWSLGWDQPGQRWRDERWEWAVRLYDDELSESGLAELKRQLGSG